ncbi:MAG: hypothetical protein L6R28_20105 [Planctomycetes bacterium]|nr:hypothetical protein [Planctomycetota bacterium]
MSRHRLLLLFLALVLAGAAGASDLDEFKVKRQDVYEFAQEPKVTRDGDRIEIAFESKGACDVTVAVENSDGKIVRHLVSGVLGPKAPPPLAKDSLKQRLVWDGKDDAGKYVDDKDSHSIRVSLGLKPEYEKDLFASPYKRVANACPVMQASPDGVYVFEGRGADFVRLFGHDGKYVKTVYPFPADKLDAVKGLEKLAFPQDGKELPVKHGFVQASMLTSGTSRLFDGKRKFGDGYGAQAMALRKDRMALGYQFINRLATDGSTGGLNLTGPEIGMHCKWGGYGGEGGGEEEVGPVGMAFSPDGKTLYLTGYMWREFYGGGGHACHGLFKLNYEDDKAKPELMVGAAGWDKDPGSDNAHFMVPAGVDVDAQGRIYVADYLNDRVQVFAPDAKYLKTIPVEKPAKVLIDPRNGEIWVFSHGVYGIHNEIAKAKDFKWDQQKTQVVRFGPFDNPQKKSAQDLGIGINFRGFFLSGPMIDFAVDWWAPQPVLWIANRKYNVSRIDVQWGGAGAYAGRDKDAWKDTGIKLLVEEKGKWAEKLNHSVLATEEVVRLKPPDFGRQRLQVNPVNEKLYVCEDSGFSKSFYQMIEVDPESGKIKPVEMPFDAEDICFDTEGQIYLRTDTLVARYNFRTWREVPWDYGEEHQAVGFTTLGGSRRTDLISGLGIPGHRPVCWNMGGMGISVKGKLIVSCPNREQSEDRRRENNQGPWAGARGEVKEGKKYEPTIYPGRARWQEVHVWDRHGQLVYEDAAAGTPIIHGVEIDAEDNIYLLSAPNRVLDGKPYWNEMAGTILKCRPKGLKVLSKTHGAVKLPEESQPKRAIDVVDGKGGPAWCEGAEWLYGGIGYGGFNTSKAGGGCDCWNSKFALDYFARSIGPETDHYSVAILDSAGNLVTRVGRYGNLDSAGPKSRVPLGGDEVGLMHPNFVASHTDRRLFIADAGNARIVSVKLRYHREARVSLKDVPDAAGK